MYVIDTYVRDARGDTVHIVGPYEVRTGLEINKKKLYRHSLYSKYLRLVCFPSYAWMLLFKNSKCYCVVGCDAV